MNTLADDHLQDKILLDRIAAIDTCKNDTVEKESFSFDRMCEEKMPKMKLQILIDRLKEIASTEDDADTILTKLIEDICTTKPESLISNLRFIQRFRSHERLYGEAAYTMTMMIAVIQQIDHLANTKAGQSQLLYSLIANSTSSLNSTTRIEENTSFMTRQMSDLNSMAVSVFNTIGFVPKAIGAAVVDTIRSRQPIKKSPSEEEQERILLARARLCQIGSFDEATVQDLRDIYEDYRRLTKGI